MEKVFRYCLIRRPHEFLTPNWFSKVSGKIAVSLLDCKINLDSKVTLMALMFFFVKALANKKSKELWFKMNFKAVKHHSAFLRDKISFLELSSHSVTSWAENWLWQGEYCHVSLFMISMVILVMVIFIMRMMLMLITVILMELMTSCVENWLWLHCQPLHGLHNGQDWHR